MKKHNLVGFIPCILAAISLAAFAFVLRSEATSYRRAVEKWAERDLAARTQLASEAIREALATFQGVKRRFDIHVNTPKIAYIDDYAHHPNEIRAAISSMRNIFPGRHLLGIFQPHLYTRTRDFADDFADALSGLDALILLPIYPAREEPIPGVSSQIIFDKVTLEDKVLIEKSRLMDTLENRTIDCLVTFGAGDVDRFIEPITEALKQRNG